jgi:hypothetical protein
MDSFSSSRDGMITRKARQGQDARGRARQAGKRKFSNADFRMLISEFEFLWIVSSFGIRA